MDEEERAHLLARAVLAAAVTGNPSPGTPDAPYSGKAYERFKRWYAAHVLRRFPGTRRRRIVRYAKASLYYAGRMVYTEGTQRGELFHRKPGEFEAAHADCSQYSASLCHWVGVKGVTDKDWTGTLAEKGVKLTEPRPGCFVFFGSPPFVHMGVMENTAQVIGFGTQSAPDRNSLAGLLAYFASQGHPGYEYRDLT